MAQNQNVPGEGFIGSVVVDELVKAGHTVIIGSGSGFSVRQVVESALRVTERGLTSVEMGRTAGHPAALVADCKRIRQELGWAPRLSDLDNIV